MQTIQNIYTEKIQTSDIRDLVEKRQRSDISEIWEEVRDLIDQRLIRPDLMDQRLESSDI